MSFDPTPLFTADARSCRPSEIRKFAKMMSDPAIISFAGGAPNPATFPAELIEEYARKVIRERRHISLQYGPTRGLPQLREHVAAITKERGGKADLDQVLLTSGSQQALSLLGYTLLDPGDIVLVELPTYIGATSAFYARRAVMAGVEQDDDGVVPQSLRDVARRVQAEGRRVKFFYTIPNFQNPSGRVMSQARRREVLDIARELDFMIIEDDPYGELVYEDGIDTTPMLAQDQDGRVIYMSSMSKVLSPAFRCGWIVAPAPVAQMVETAKESYDLCSPMLDEAIVEEFCSAGELPKQIARVRSFYRERRAALLGALEERLSGVARWTEASGGLFTFVSFTNGTDTVELLPKAVAAGVAFVPGQPFFVDGSGRETMRLTFAKEADDRLREGVARIARVIN